MLEDGSHECESLKEFYKLTFTEQSIQKELIGCSTLDSFIQKAVEIAQEHGLRFTKEEMKSSISRFKVNTDTLPIFDATGWEGHEWEKKIVDVGWVPLGYSRT